jgi:hypothetical protein
MDVNAILHSRNKRGKKLKSLPTYRSEAQRIAMGCVKFLLFSLICTERPDFSADIKTRQYSYIYRSIGVRQLSRVPRSRSIHSAHQASPPEPPSTTSNPSVSQQPTKLLPLNPPLALATPAGSLSAGGPDGPPPVPGFGPVVRGPGYAAVALPGTLTAIEVLAARPSNLRVTGTRYTSPWMT